MKIELLKNVVVDEFEDKLVITLKDKNDEIDFTKAIIIEDVGKFIFIELQKKTPVTKILKKIIDTYSVDKQTSEKDFYEFIEQLKEAGVIYVG